MAIILFLVVLFVLILVHEWGHFIVAKKTGMRVDEFGIGFPPKLFGKKWHGTEYTFNMLPIGGFVKIAGENGNEGEVLTSDMFGSKSKIAQAAVLVAGVTMNILFAWFLLLIVFMVGIPTAVQDSDATEAAMLTVTQVIDGSPAGTANIPVGAGIIEVSAGNDVESTLTPASFHEFITNHGADSLTITYLQGNSETQITLAPKIGVITDDPESPAIGVALSMIQTVRLPLYKAVIEATQTTVHSLGAITIGLTKLAIQSIQGTANYSEVAGPIGIVGLVGTAAQFGITSVLMFMAVISLNLAVINLLPFPALDGGRLVMVGIEAVIRRPINPVWAARVNLAGFGLLMLLMIVVTYHDIIKMI